MMKPGLGISFWFLYTLGFTVALPTFLYYNINFGEPPQEAAGTAFLYLGLGAVSWLVLIGLYCRFFIKMVFTDKHRLEKTAREGTTVVARIIHKVQTGVLRDTVTLKLRLAFSNFAGTEVELPYELNDSRPFEKRFEVGNTIEMSASVSGKQVILVPKSIEVSRNKGIVVLYSVIFLLLLAAAFVYPAFSYGLESQGSGWRFLRLSHPWISVPLINIGAGIFIMLLMGLISRASGKSDRSLHIVMYGVKTTGTIINFQQTGTYINEQPQVQFEIEYTDQQNNGRKTIYKKVVSLLDMHKLDCGPKEIMFLPDKPERIVFYEDLTL